ncbi:MAG: hypothetical protein EAY69_10175 [Cytophagales bacterium]|nr:MAG: hypothetical protein EAY69_10175 [Cytophagales bacterium]
MKKKYVLMAILCLYTTYITAQYRFDYKNFAKSQGITLEGNAYKDNKNIVLTNSELSQRGGLWHTQQKVNIKHGFKTEFTFRIHKNDISWETNVTGADGIAFVFHNNSTAVDQGLVGGGIGYEGIKNSVAVELDTWANDDENDNHIAIQSKGADQNVATIGATLVRNAILPVVLKDGKVHKVNIEYKDKKMLIFLNGNKVIDKEIDLATTINLENNEKMWIGFTSSTGAAFSQHEIHSWSFEEYLEKPVVVENKPIVIEKPKTLEDRTIVGKNKIKVKSRKITLEVWDQGLEDGDIISLNYNNKWILENFTIKKRKKIIEIDLEGKNNYLILHAINLGSSPPNTVAIAIKDGKKTHKTFLNSNMKASDSIEIMYEEK